MLGTKRGSTRNNGRERCLGRQSPGRGAGLATDRLPENPGRFRGHTKDEERHESHRHRVALDVRIDGKVETNEVADTREHRNAEANASQAKAEMMSELKASVFAVVGITGARRFASFDIARRGRLRLANHGVLRR